MTEPPALPPARIADLLAASVATVVAELVSLGDDGGWRPEPGEWSANECVGHMIEAERRGFAGRIRRILAADRPDIPADSRTGTRRLSPRRGATISGRPPSSPPSSRRSARTA